MRRRELQAERPERLVVRKNLIIDALSARIVSALHDAGVETMLFKGPVIARRVYQRGEIRPYGDCDLLICRRDLAAAETALARLGMARDALHEQALPEWERHAHSWRLDTQVFTLDLHWTLIHVGVESDTLWEVFKRDAVSMRLGGVDMCTPADPQLAVILALHAAQHGVDWSRPQEDLRRALEVFPPAVWQSAARVAEEVDASAAFAAGVRLVPRGAEVARALALPEERSFEVLVSTGHAGRGARDLDRFVRAPGVLAKARVALGAAFPSTARMRETRPVAAWGRGGLALAYAMQPVHVVARLSSSLRQWHRARRTARRP